MLNKFTNLLKDKKKGYKLFHSIESTPEQKITVLMPVEEFFNRAGFEIDTDNIWKMTSGQLESSATKQEKFLKHLKKLYKTVYLIQ
jgi:hypothetical protein